MANPQISRVFFYGLFMDVAVLEEQGIRPRHLQRAELHGYAIRIADRATLIPSAHSVTHGMLAVLRPEDLTTLYSRPGLEGYAPTAVIVRTMEGDSVPGLCYLLTKIPELAANREYADKLAGLARRLGFPEAYVQTIREAPKDAT